MMIKQYTRILTDQATGEVAAAISQDLPFVDGYNPIEKAGITTDTFDFELDVDEPDSDFKDQTLMRGREILDNFEVKNGQPQLKPSAPKAIKDKCLAIGTVKNIQESSVKSELRQSIIDILVANGQTEAIFVSSINTGRKTPIKSISELPPVALIRIKKSLEGA